MGRREERKLSCEMQRRQVDTVITAAAVMVMRMGMRILRKWNG